MGDEPLIHLDRRLQDLAIRMFVRASTQEGES